MTDQPQWSPEYWAEEMARIERLDRDRREEPRPRGGWLWGDNCGRTINSDGSYTETPRK